MATPPPIVDRPAHHCTVTGGRTRSVGMPRASSLHMMTTSSDDNLRFA